MEIFEEFSSLFLIHLAALFSFPSLWCETYKNHLSQARFYVKNKFEVRILIKKNYPEDILSLFLNVKKNKKILTQF